MSAYDANDSDEDDFEEFRCTMSDLKRSRVSTAWIPLSAAGERRSRSRRPPH